MADRPQLAIVSYKRGQYIIVEGKAADSFFIIREGRVVLARESELTQDKHAVMGPGDMFGVVSAMSGHTHIETAQAVTDVTLLSVPVKQYEGLIQYNSPIAIKVIRQFSARMRSLNDELAKYGDAATVKQAEGAELDLTEALFKTGEFYFSKKDFPRAYYAYKKYTEQNPAGLYAEACGKRLAALKGKVPEPAPVAGFTRAFKKGDVVFMEGEAGTELYVIASGSVQISKMTPSGELVLAVLKQGDMFGEMALLESKPRSATATVFEDCSLIVIAVSNFEYTATHQPQLIGRLTNALAERIWFSNKQLVNAQIADPMGRMYDGMNMYLEQARVATEGTLSWQFHFGPEQLAKMVHIPDASIPICVGKLLKDSSISVLQGKIVSRDVHAIANISATHRKLRQRNMAAS